MSFIRPCVVALLSCCALIACQQSASTSSGTSADLQARLEASEAQVAALTERVEALTPETAVLMAHIAVEGYGVLNV